MDAERAGDPDFDLDPDLDGEPDFDLEPDRDLDREPDLEADLDRERDLEADLDFDRDFDLEPDLDREPDLDLERDLEREPDLELAGDPDLDLERDRDLDLEADRDLLDPEREPDADLDLERLGLLAGDPLFEGSSFSFSESDETILCFFPFPTSESPASLPDEMRLRFLPLEPSSSLSLDLPPLPESESSLEEMVSLETMRSRCFADMPESLSAAAAAFLLTLPPLRPRLFSFSPPSLRLMCSFFFFLRGLSSPSEPDCCFLRFFFSLTSPFSTSPPSSLLSLT